MNNNGIVKQNKAVSMIINGLFYKEYYKNRNSEIGTALTIDVIANSKKTAITLIEERRTRKQSKAKARGRRSGSNAQNEAKE